MMNEKNLRTEIDSPHQIDLPDPGNGYDQRESPSEDQVIRRFRLVSLGPYSVTDPFHFRIHLIREGRFVTSREMVGKEQ